MLFFLHPLLRPLLLAAALAAPALLPAAVVGTNIPALPLTAARINALPAAEQPAWHRYLAQSRAKAAIDAASLAAELTAASLSAPLVPAKGRGVSALLSVPTTDWSSADLARLATHVVSFQTPAGGWNKNTDQTTAPRRPGERSGNEAGYVGTIDNDATVAQLRFLAKVLAAQPNATGAPALRSSFDRGLDYLLAAQYPHGGWPQVYPLEGSYHDAVTFNDGAIVNVLSLLRAVAAGAGDYAFTSADHRARAAAAFAHGLDCILASQITVAGRRTVWCQQVDVLTLAPVGARNYEMPSLSSGESAGLVLFLLTLPEPSPAVVAAVHAAATWFQKTPLHDVVFKPAPDGTGRKLLPSPGAGPLWPRYSEIGSDRPLFGDRDLTIHDDVNEISLERRNGYGWFGDAPKRVLDHYTKWSKLHPQK
jgi:PelA/Pel-15E family pectate lyase